MIKLTCCGALILAGAMLAVTPAQANKLISEAMGCTSTSDARLWKNILETSDKGAIRSFLQETFPTGRCEFVEKDTEVEVLEDNVKLSDGQPFAQIRKRGSLKSLWIIRLYLDGRR